MKKNLVRVALIVLAALVLTACSGASVVLPEGMSSAMSARADLYDAQYAGDAEMNVARICVQTPAGLYWNESIQTWAVVCKMPLPNMYGAVMLDANYTVLSSQHINAVSLTGLEEMIASVGWVKK
jgi:hypothetical protein